MQHHAGEHDQDRRHLIGHVARVHAFADGRIDHVEDQQQKTPVHPYGDALETEQVPGAEGAGCCHIVVALWSAEGPAIPVLTIMGGRDRHAGVDGVSSTCAMVITPMMTTKVSTTTRKIR